jgi:hypothetical protein
MAIDLMLGAELEKFRIKSSRDLKLNIVVSKAIYSDVSRQSIMGSVKVGILISFI